MLPGELDRDALVLRGGVKTAAFRAPAIFNGFAAEQRRQPFQSGIVPRIHKAVARRRARNVASVECRDGQSFQGLRDETAQFVLADILIQYPEEVAYFGCAAIF